jgi:hypothetical protein
VIDTCSRFSGFFGTAHGGWLAYALGYTGLGVGASRFGAQVMLDLLAGRPFAARRRPAQPRLRLLVDIYAVGADLEGELPPPWLRRTGASLTWKQRAMKPSSRSPPTIASSTPTSPRAPAGMSSHSHATKRPDRLRHIPEPEDEDDGETDPEGHVGRDERPDQGVVTNFRQPCSVTKPLPTGECRTPCRRSLPPNYPTACRDLQLKYDAISALRLGSAAAREGELRVQTRLTDDTLVHEAPAIVGRRTPSALAHAHAS